MLARELPCAALIAMALVGCEPPSAEEHSVRSLYLEPGITTRSAIIGTLGAPDDQYEGGSIAGYGMAEEPARELLHTRSTPSRPAYDLILVFGPDGTIEHYRLVRVW